jgi:hypothetical protein
VRAFVSDFEANFGCGIVARRALKSRYTAMTASDEVLAAEVV